MDELKRERDLLADLEILFNEKRYPEALSFAEEISKEFPSSFQIKLLHAKILKELNKLDEAEDLVKQGISNFPDNVNLLLEMGDIYSKNEEYNLATEYYNKVVFIDPFNSKAKGFIEKIDEIRKKRAVKAGFSADSITHEKEEIKKDLDEINISESKTDTTSERAAGIEEDVKQRESEEDKEILKFQEAGIEVEEITDEDIKLDQEINNQFSDLKIGKEISVEKMDDTINEIDFGDEFVTESAAKLYIDQGLYGNAIGIYEKLFKKSQGKKYSEKIKKIKNNEKIIKKLEIFLEQIHKIGEKVV